MSTYVVMAPPEFEDVAGDPRQTDRLAFVPDGFSALAFLFAVIWLLVNRMWLVLLGYLAATLVIELLAARPQWMVEMAEFNCCCRS